ncbi:MAG: PIN domain-containing protein [Brevundimonas sp.]|uniref:PIN domain-containing protein n=1 Tax=Brevundimonas sp. TaxID=1871086 RepID=UPI0025B98CB3|nr:PIN domain-containing protein [Brevundimonas sp.]MBX3477826.1 PIN domain-containing protein [Brevundimonas sp.]
MIHLDTHVVLWLAQRRLNVLGDAALRLVRRHPWTVSPFVLLELELLHEIDRIRASPQRVLGALAEVGDVSISATSAQEVVEAARPLSWTRDPMDRLIAGAALAERSPLITADGVILKNLPSAVWD